MLAFPLDGPVSFQLKEASRPALQHSPGPDKEPYPARAGFAPSLGVLRQPIRLSPYTYSACSIASHKTACSALPPCLSQATGGGDAGLKARQLTTSLPAAPVEVPQTPPPQSLQKEG